MSQSLTILIPAAGQGTRMRPQTWSKPKPLVGVAGKTALDHLLDTFRSLPAGTKTEYVLIVSPYLGEQQIPPYLQEHYPDHRVHYVLQPVARGQSDALWLARTYLSGPTLVVFSDTLVGADFSLLKDEQADCVAWVKPMSDPRRFGVAEVGPDGWVTRLIEKPLSVENHLVVVGCYYFREGRALTAAIEEQMKRDQALKGEFYLVDAINIMLERNARVRTQGVDVWLDTGTIEATLATNRYLLEHGACTDPLPRLPGVKFIPPVAVHPTAVIHDAVVGPYVSVGAGARITASRMEDSILEDEVTVDHVALKGSFLGRQSQVQGRSAENPPMVLNISDNSTIRV
jgi:glucose-1-phosphate thymidylyltransferase